MIVGYESETHIGAHFRRAAQQMDNIDVMLIDPSPAFRAPRVIQKINWWILGKRPARLAAFGQDLIALCTRYQPDILLVTGITPPDSGTLQQIRSMGIRTVNYLTDDPWNRSHQTSWFLSTLPHYDLICSPRRSNLEDLARLGCHAVWVPFGYEPSIHYPELPPPELQHQFECDVLFYGGADQDRVPYIKALIQAGIRPHLYGGYWDRYAATRPFHKGMACPQELRWAVSMAKVSLCMVRRANRDGHVMRSYEVPAMGGCMLTEDTQEHREIFGAEGDRTVYFNNAHDLVRQACDLIADSSLRRKLSDSAHEYITSHQNTYYDRLAQIVTCMQTPPY
jgi:hypothetical protein